MSSLDKQLFIDISLKREDTASERRETALQAAFLCHRSALNRYLERKLGCRAEAEDMSQEIYLRLVRYDRAENITNHKAFLFTTAANLVRDYYRKEAVRRTYARMAGQDKELLTDRLSPEVRLAAKERLHKFEQALKELKPNCRRAFVLHRFEYLTYAQIAKVMRISVAMVEYHIMCALAHFTARLGDEK